MSQRVVIVMNDGIARGALQAAKKVQNSIFVCQIVTVTITENREVLQSKEMYWVHTLALQDQNPGGMLADLKHHQSGICLRPDPMRKRPDQYLMASLEGQSPLHVRP